MLPRIAAHQYGDKNKSKGGNKFYYFLQFARVSRVPNRLLGTREFKFASKTAFLRSCADHRQKHFFHQIRKFVLDFKGEFADSRMSQNQPKSNYKDCSFGNRDSFVKGTRLSVLILEKPHASRKFEALEVACLVSI